MNAKNALQGLVHHTFDADSVNGASLDTASGQWDTAGLASYSIILGAGDTVGAAVATFTVHAADNSGFTADANNKIGEITSGLPDGARECAVIDVLNAEVQGRYVQVIATAGASASDLYVHGIGIPKDGRGLSATDRGCVAVGDTGTTINSVEG